MSEENATVEDDNLDIMSLLPNKGEDADDMDTEDEPGDLPADDDVAGWKAKFEAEKDKVSKRNKSLKIAKNSSHRIQDEYDALITRVDKMEQQAVSTQSNKATDKLVQDEQAWQERLEDDPSMMPEYIRWSNRNLEGKFVNVIDARDQKIAELQSQLNSTKQASNPEMQKYSSEIEQVLRLDENLTKTQALNIVKGFSAIKVPRGTVGGGRTGAVRKAEDDFDGLNKKEALEKMGFDT